MNMKSLWADVEKAEHSTVVWFENEYAHLHSAMPEITAVADKILPYASLLLQTVLDGLGQSAAAKAAATVISKAQNSLDVVNAVVYDTGATPTAAAAINAVATNLTGLVSAAQISNAKSVATVQKTVSELQTFVAAFPSAVAATPLTPANPPAPPASPDLGAEEASAQAANA